ncbi:MAG: AAA family ATPase [Actinomycetota bacterium]|nr:AAA family ATPase [Actinomycetota bacterium]
MKIISLKVKNFKSFQYININPSEFNVLIGANASGKSNFTKIFSFLNDIAKYGLNNAISMQGGIEYLLNFNMPRSDGLYMQINYAFKDDVFISFTLEENDELLQEFIMEPQEVIYEFLVVFDEENEAPKVKKDRISMKCMFFHTQKKGRERKKRKGEEIGSGNIQLYRSGNKLKSRMDLPEGIKIENDELYPAQLLKQELENDQMIINHPVSGFFLLPVINPFVNIPIYNFDINLQKKAAQISGKKELEEDGSNLAIVLKNIIEDEAERRKFITYIKELLPFVERMEVEKFADKSLLFGLREIYNQDIYIPSSLISDGTINVTGLIIALFFEHKRIIIIEEPERNLHPSLISRLIYLMKESSVEKQVFITTHNPETIKHVDREDIFLISRNESGYSTIMKPIKSKAVSAFLKNEVGMEELYINNMLGD